MKMKKIFTFVIVSGVFSAPLISYAQTYYPYSPTYSNYDSWMYQNPQVNWCGSYYGSCQIGIQHVFAPYTYVNVSPYTNVDLPGQGSYQYPTQTYTYPNQQAYNYSYPQYQSGYSQPTYYQSNYQPSYYQDYGNGNHPVYASSYMSGHEYCYSGYGCYPFYVRGSAPMGV